MVVSPLIVGLLLAADLMHASWNALLKSDTSDRLTTFGVIMATGTVMGLAIVPFMPAIEPAAWPYLALSVAIHILYYVFLLKAYSYGDLSHTYPIARGLGPLLVALVSGRLIGEHLRGQDIVGVVLLSCGLIALALPLRPRSFDAVVAAFSLNHLDEPATAVREIAGVTRKAGLLLASVYANDDDHPVKRAAEQLALGLVKGGFDHPPR